jgi:hypothetical protein
MRTTRKRRIRAHAGRAVVHLRSRLDHHKM